MKKKYTLSLLINLTGYGFQLEYLRFSRMQRGQVLLTPHLLETFVLKFFTLYVTSQGAPLNRYFAFLASRKKTYNLELESFNLLTYNNQAIKGLKTTLAFFFSMLQQNRRVIFIADQETNKEFGFSKLNFLLWPRLFYPTLEQLGTLNYYYNNLNRLNIEQIPQFREGFDMAVFCARDYHRINQATFRKVGRVTVGVCSTATRPDLFDYPLVINGNYRFTVQWIIALALLNHGGGSSF